VKQAIGMVERGTATTAGSGSFSLRVGTIRLLGDQPGTLQFAKNRQVQLSLGLVWYQ